MKSLYEHDDNPCVYWAGFRPEGDHGEKENGYMFKPKDVDWYKAKGCEEVKVCAGEGDLIRE